LIAAGRISPGQLVSFLFYAGLVVRAFRTLSTVAAKLLETHAAMDRIFELLRREPAMPLAGGLRPEHPRGRLELEGVYFRYVGRPEAEVLRGVNLSVEPGELVALVGASGSGKSTVLSILARFYDPDRGVARFDGRDLRELDPTWLRRQVLLVGQDAAIFSRSLRENLLFGLSDVSSEELESALRAAQAWSFVAALPQGLESTAGDRGLSLSGGQRQRLALARALLRHPRALLLDEATSALDAETEAAVKDALRKLPGAPTVVVVAHRLSTVADADRVIVLSQGVVAASGRHEDLLRSSLAYRELVETQLVAE
jgi:ATP-binding cassette subfamily B protein